MYGSLLKRTKTGSSEEFSSPFNNSFSRDIKRMNKIPIKKMEFPEYNPTSDNLKLTIDNTNSIKMARQIAKIFQSKQNDVAQKSCRNCKKKFLVFIRKKIKCAKCGFLYCSK